MTQDPCFISQSMGRLPFLGFCQVDAKHCELYLEWTKNHHESCLLLPLEDYFSGGGREQACFAVDHERLWERIQKAVQERDLETEFDVPFALLENGLPRTLRFILRYVTTISSCQDGEALFRFQLAMVKLPESIEIDSDTVASCQTIGYWFYDRHRDRFFHSSHRPQSGKTLEEIISLFYDDDQARMREQWRHLLQDGKFLHAEARFRGGDENYSWMQWTTTKILWDQNGRSVNYVYGMSMNIDERKRMELRLESEKRCLERLIERAPFGLFKTRKDGYTEYLNQTYYDMTGLTPESALGFGWQSIYLKEDVTLILRDWVVHLDKENQKLTDKIYPIRRVDGEKRYFRCYWTSENKYEEDLGIGLLLDVTVEVVTQVALQKRTEELKFALSEAEKATRLKSEFLAVISHEIRTPLNGILGMASLLGESKVDEEQNQMLDVITDCGTSLLELINDVLELSKIEAGLLQIDCKALCARSVVTSIFNMFQTATRHKNLQFTTSVSENVPNIVWSDQAKLKRVLMNLVGNSLKFTEKGSIAVQCSVDESRKCSSDEIALFFAVKDTGIGISDESIKDLFKLFSQVDSSVSRKYGGTGLGLAISKRIIEAMKGEIFVKSAVDQGTEFSFSIIAKKVLEHASNEAEAVGSIRALDQSMEEEDESNEDWSRLKVLLVEDNKINQQIAERMLKKLGVPLDCANDGFQGISAVEQKRYDVILMDISMPLMSGYEATRHIRTHLPSHYTFPPYIVAMTANALSSDRDKCFAAGMNDFIAKPFDFADLRRAFHNTCRYLKLETELFNQKEALGCSK